MAQAQYRTLSKRVLDRLSVNGKDAIFWDRDLAGFGIRVLPLGQEGLRRPDPRVRPVEARNARSVSRSHSRGSPQERHCGHRPNQEGPASGSAGAGAGSDRCRPRGALSAGIRRDALQAGDGVALPAHTAQAHRACPRGAARRGRGTQGHPEFPQRAASHAHGGEPRRRHPGQDVQPGGCVGMASRRKQSPAEVWRASRSRSTSDS